MYSTGPAGAADRSGHAGALSVASAQRWQSKDRKRREAKAADVQTLLTDPQWQKDAEAKRTEAEAKVEAEAAAKAEADAKAEAKEKAASSSTRHRKRKVCVHTFIQYTAVLC